MERLEYKLLPWIEAEVLLPHSQQMGDRVIVKGLLGWDWANFGLLAHPTMILDGQIEEVVFRDRLCSLLVLVYRYADEQLVLDWLDMPRQTRDRFQQSSSWPSAHSSHEDLTDGLPQMTNDRYGC